MELVEWYNASPSGGYRQFAQVRVLVRPTFYCFCACPLSSLFFCTSARHNHFDQTRHALIVSALFHVLSSTTARRSSPPHAGVRRQGHDSERHGHAARHLGAAGGRASRLSGSDESGNHFGGKFKVVCCTARVQSVAPLFPHSPIITSMLQSPMHVLPRSPVASPPAVQPFSGGGAAGGASGQHFDQSARQAWVAAQKQRDALPLILHGNQTTFIENTSHFQWINWPHKSYDPSRRFPKSSGKPPC